MPHRKKTKRLIELLEKDENISDKLTEKDLDLADIERLRKEIRKKLHEPNPKPAAEVVPGPGQYETTPLKLSPRTPRIVPPLFEKDKSASPGSGVPGPGSYTHEFPPARSARVIGRPPESILARPIFQVPGPGRYNVPSIVGAEGPKYGFGLKYEHAPHVKIEAARKPGPGCYSIPSEFENKHSTMDPTWQPVSKKRTLKPLPGPGTYDTNHDVTSRSKKDSPG